MCEEKVMPYSGKIKKTDFGVVIPNQSSVKSKYTNITPDILNRYRLHFLGASHKLKGQMTEKMDLKKADMGDVIKDFYKSDAPQFKGKSKKKRRDMAIAAKLEAEGKPLNASYNMDEAAAAAIPAIARIGAQTFGKALTSSAAKATAAGALTGAGILAIKGGESNFEKLRKMREKGEGADLEKKVSKKIRKRDIFKKVIDDYKTGLSAGKDVESTSSTGRISSTSPSDEFRKREGGKSPAEIARELIARQKENLKSKRDANKEIDKKLGK